VLLLLSGYNFIYSIRHFYFRFCAEQKGRTLHLLKQSSKPVPQERKRRQIALKGTFQQFKQMQEEQKHE